MKTASSFACLFLCLAAYCGEAEERVRDLIIDAVEDGARPVAYIEMFGRPARGKVVGATEEGLELSIRGQTVSSPWKALQPKRLLGLASSCADQDSAEDQMALARYASSQSLDEEAMEYARRAATLDPRFTGELKKLEGELEAAENVDVERRAEAALERLEKLAAKGRGGELERALASFRRNYRATKVAGERAAKLAELAEKAGKLEEEEKKKREAARLPRNHEGRTLPPLPRFAEPVLCNTPEADRILSSMQIFPKDNHWNAEITKLPTVPNSDAIIANMGPAGQLRPCPYFTFIIVPPNQPKIEVEFDPYPAECNKEPYPIPDNTPIQGWEDPYTGTGDRHAFVVDPFAGRSYELYHTYRTATGWKCFGAIFDLNSNRLRRRGYTSADAAGLPMFPAFIRYDECERGMVEHAMRIVPPITRRECIYPATHVASPRTDPNLPAMGERIRLKAGVDISFLSKHSRAVALGLKKYGMFVADNGDNWAICAVADKRLRIRDLGKLKAADFEVVDTTSLPRP